MKLIVHQITPYHKANKVGKIGQYSQFLFYDQLEAWAQSVQQLFHSLLATKFKNQ